MTQSTTFSADVFRTALEATPDFSLQNQALPHWLPRHRLIGTGSYGLSVTVLNFLLAAVCNGQSRRLAR